MTLNKLSASQSWPTASNNRSSTCRPPTTSCVDRLLCNQRLLFQPIDQYLHYSPLQLPLNFQSYILPLLHHLLLTGASSSSTPHEASPSYSTTATPTLTTRTEQTVTLLGAVISPPRQHATRGSPATPPR